MINTGPILIIEDDPDSAEAFRLGLEGAGYVCEVFGSAEEALPHLSTAGALVLDLALPGMDGWGVLKEAAAHNVPAVIVSAFHDPDVADQAERKGAAGSFPKPVNLEELLACLSGLKT